MVKFENIKVAKISESIVKQIEEFIISGALKNGERLPPERELAEQLNVSRPSIREAISILEAKGLITSKQGGGTFVTDTFSDELTGSISSILKEHPETALDVLELRHALEEIAAYYAAIRATKTDKKVIQKRLDTLVDCYKSSEINNELESKSDVEFHLAIADATHNFALIHVMRGLFDALHLTVSHNLERIRETPKDHKVIQTQHLNICEAVLNGQADKARQLAHEHLAFVEKKLNEMMRDEKREKQSRRRVGDDAEILNIKN